MREYTAAVQASQFEVPCDTGPSTVIHQVMGDPRVGSASFCETGEGGSDAGFYKEGTLDLDLKSEKGGDREGQPVRWVLQQLMTGAGSLGVWSPQWISGVRTW